MAPKISYIFTFTCTFFLFYLAIAHPTHSNLHLKDEKISPYQFLKSLHGSVKGDKIEGVKELKQYLKMFGYLRNEGYQNTNIFDDNLESAIKAYQHFNKLNVTGHIDDATLSLMMMPRCGMPDYVDGNLSPDYTFVNGKPRWKNKRNLTYSFYQSSRKDVIGALARAFKRWADETPLGFTFVYTEDYNAADLKLSFKRLWHGDWFPFDGKSGITAHTFMNKAIVHFDGDEDWFANGDGNVYEDKLDMVTVAMHEIGHLLGLGHSQDKNALMYATIEYGTSKTITDDDRNGLIKLYN